MGVVWEVKVDNSSTVLAAQRATVQRILQQGAEAIRERASTTHDWQDRTGETAGSGQVVQAGSGTSLTYLVTFDGAALYLEFGTVHAPAYPFLGPATEQVFPEILASLQGGGFSASEEIGIT